MRPGKIFRLASRDYLHEWQMSGCFILALAAVLGPMLVLFGLKFGIVGGMIDQLIQNPGNREIRPIGSGHYTAAWLRRLQQRPDVAFLTPRTRSIAATIQLSGGRTGRIITTELIPSGQGDPLLASVHARPHGYTGVVLSTSAANKLEVKTGETIDGSIMRIFRDQNDRVHLPLKVLGIVPSAAFPRDGVFASLPLVLALEDFRDGRAVPALNWTGDAPVLNRIYPSFRLYASTIYDVAGLKKRLNEQGIDVRTQAADIALVIRMDHNLSIIYWAIALIGLIGFALSLGASLWANVDRKRKELSVLRLVGFRTSHIVWFPVIQAFYTAVGGWILAVGIYQGVAFAINRMLGPQLSAGEKVCVLLPQHYLAALALTVGAAILASALAGWRSARIEPAEGLREI